MARRSITTIGLMLVAFNCLGIISCSPHLRETMQVPVIPIGQMRSGAPSATSSDVYVDQFRDGRDGMALAQIGAEQSNPASDIGISVQRAVSDGLRARGFSIVDSAPVIISGEVRKWIARVKGGLPSSVDTEANIYIEVFDPANKRIYSGNYEGNISRQETSLNELEIQQALGTAMSEAIGQMLADKRLTSLLSSY